MSGNETAFPSHTPLGMAYVPFQQWGEVYPEDIAFNCGTLFPQLNFPFERGADCNE
ncbi:MAG: spore coat associated protein CotJA [Ruminococcus sp.]|nr:spore coat associated protein CotJA [Ruminococcus sp.]